ncbi:hypothetical protein F5879DRAFT_970724 [Lentinula edodes]|uniref:Uncharacterized protein n=1 Tax=Lentinula edodes TaxID=5353 RepID=A0A1Q3DV99_LENED|nr:hypothetical protein HHX47_DHR10000255 [Lentinula edodes]KAJ3900897.1 hypothetical protein F5879DRAFT_970724 [Lentinula edodes]GAV98688.1 hypothetical protein LENED_000081 [Lentinula edodes]
MSSTGDNVVPLKLHRLLSLFMAFSFAVISGSVGLNSLVKSNQQTSTVKKLLPAGTSLVVDDNDVFHSGVVITTISALIALLTLIYILLLLLSHRMTKNNRFTRLSNQLLPFEWMSLAFCAVWLFATQVPFTHFFATRSAQVTAFAGNVQIPPGLVQIVENQLGFTTVYRRIHYLRLLAILPWFAFLFTSIAAVVSFLASRRRPARVNRVNSGSDEKN